MGIPDFPDTRTLRESGPEKFSNAGQVFGRIDAWARRLVCDVDCNFVAMPHGAQLFQSFAAFNRGGRQLGKRF